MVEQEQEEQGRLEGPRVRALFLGLLMLPACGGSEASPPSRVPADLEARLAWVGETAKGLWVVAEGLAPSPDGFFDQEEEAVLKRVLHVPEGHDLFRLHILGVPYLLGESGRVFPRDGIPWESFGIPAEGLSSRGRLIWEGLGRGGPSPVVSGAHRRSFLFIGEPLSSGLSVPLRWESGQEEVFLEPRHWTESERREFLQEAPSPSSP